MDQKDQLQEFDLEDILNEFHDQPEEDTQEEPPAQPAPEVPADTPEQEEPSLEELLSAIDGEEPQEPAQEDAEPTLSKEGTVRLDSLDDVSGTAPKEAVHVREPLEFNPHEKLRELKRKLVAGPERRYYELSETGVGKLQAAIAVNALLVLLSAGVAALYALDLVPEYRTKLLIFSQILIMLVSGLTGSHLMLDGLGELAKGRFTLNTLSLFTFLVCCADAVICLEQLRVPCCAAFSLEMLMALLARYQRRSTEMAQMDTLRKAVRLNSMVKVPNYYQDRDGILRGLGSLEDFWDNYQKAPAPETVQNVYAFISFLGCIAISVLAGTRHNIELGIQILATSLLVAVPAGYFVAMTRPMYTLQKRLHMVGAVLCGWQGIRGFRGKLAFPLKDEDLFPKNSTKLNGIKFYGDRDPDEVIRYTASMILAAGGGLTHVFQHLLKNRNTTELPVLNFQNYGAGGIGGEVNGEPVLLGSLSFLQDMGVEIPEGTMVAQAIYTSIDGQLSAVVAISYAKMRSASAGLVSLAGTRQMRSILVIEDFMLTESLIRGKFGIRSRRLVFPDAQTRKALTAVEVPENAPALALTTRDELVSYAYAMNGARALRWSWGLGNFLNILGGIVGMAIMAALAWLGNTELLVPTNIFLYQLIWLIPGLLITEWTRTV